MARVTGLDVALPENNLQGYGSDHAAQLERRTLWLVLWINATMFLVEQLGMARRIKWTSR
jgi:Co/Zn/Cd efflux system component